MNTPLLPVAVPSWLIPGTAAENIRFLTETPDALCAAQAGCVVTEMGLLCFETASSLTCPLSDWGEPEIRPVPSNSTSLPASLASPGRLSRHVHLPTDIFVAHADNTDSPTPPDSGPLLEIMARLAPLGVHRAVLHPPADPALLGAFVERWQAAGHAPADLLLENHRDISARALCRHVDRHPVSVCLDVAHALTFERACGRKLLLSRLDPDRVRLVHWSAPGPVAGKDAHLPLTSLTTAERAFGRAVALRFADALPLVEVFSAEGVRDSLPVLRELYTAGPCL